METFQLKSRADLLALVPGNLIGCTLLYHSGLNNSELFVNSAVVRQGQDKIQRNKRTSVGVELLWALWA